MNLGVDAESKYYNIWKEALKNKAQKTQTASSDRTLIVVGPPKSGKTTFIKTLRGNLETDTRPTCVIDYCSFRRQSALKEVINVYQIASKSQIELIAPLLTKETILGVTFYVCVDLAKPNSMMTDMEEWLGLLRKECQTAIGEKLSTQEKFKIQQQRQHQAINSHSDCTSLNPMPIKTVIVATKFDQFERYDFQNRKWLNKALRFVAHSNWCSLYCSSSKNPQLIAQLRQTIDSVLFYDKKEPLLKKIDYQRPFFISNGGDALQSISVPSSGSLRQLEALKKQLSVLFPGEDEPQREESNLTQQLKEYRIDSLIDERKRELMRIIKNLKNASFVKAKP